MITRIHVYRRLPIAALFILCLLPMCLPSASTAAPDCQHDINTICGVANAEDLLWMPGTGKLIASGLAGTGGPGRLYIVDPATSAVNTLYPGPASGNCHRGDWFADCPRPPNPENFSAHGLSLLSLGDSRFRLYVVAHGSRESVEVFEIDADAAIPSATWVGCVKFPANDSINSVAALPDGGFYATRLSEQSENFGLSRAGSGEKTGFLYEWRPGGGLTRIAGTDMAFPNGIVSSPDGEQVYVASWGGQKIVRFLPGEDWKMDAEATLDFRPDNLRWSADGQILTAGQRLDPDGDCGQLFCIASWAAASIDPDSMAVTTIAEGTPGDGFLGATVAVSASSASKGYWLGTFTGDRIIRMPAAAIPER